MKSNSKQVRDAAKAYLLECIMSTSPTDWGIDTDDLKTRLQIIADEFRSAANHPYNLRRIPNDQDRFIDWMNGLPSCLPVDFENYRIVEILESWGLVNDKGYSVDKSFDLFNYIIYRELIKLLTSNGLEL